MVAGTQDPANAGDAGARMTTAFGSFTLQRPHTPATSPLRAWSAADQLVLDHLAELGPGPLGRVLIVNDEFGALSCGLTHVTPTVWTDSVLSRTAITNNLVANSLRAAPADQMVRGDETPQGHFDTVVIRVPKTAALLNYQLAVVRSVIDTSTRVVGAGMARHIHNSTVHAFERLIGPTTTSRATRKARLIHAEPAQPAEPAEQVGARPGQPTATFTTDSGLRIVEYPGTFSAGHVDVGTALLLETLATTPPPAAGALVADLGCGNGVLAAELAARWPDARFLLLDVSDLAVDSAKQTWQANALGEAMTAEVADGFETTASDSVDIVITNPPFHQGHALDADLTDRLLADVARVLRPKGCAYVVAQRHLHLHTRMKRWFTTVEVASKHPTHVVLKVS